MITFENIFKNHFNTDRISDDNMQKYTVDQIGRIIAHNGSGTYNGILSDTNAAYTGYFGNMSSEDIAFTVQQSLTISVDKIITNFKADASKFEGAVRTAYGKDSGTYQEFYPLGINEYTVANKSNVKLLMTRLDNAYAAHSADFPSYTVTLFHNYPLNFEAGRSAQLTKIGEVSTKKTDTASNRNVLEVQLLKNVFFIGFTNAGNVDVCLSFFDQSILHAAIDTDNDGKGQVEVLARVAGVPVKYVTFEFVGESTRKFHSAADGTARSSKVVAPSTKVLRATKPGLKPKDISVNIEDAGIGHVDFDMETE